jgi:hypothetical protein
MNFSKAIPGIRLVKISGSEKDVSLKHNSDSFSSKYLAIFSRWRRRNAFHAGAEHIRTKRYPEELVELCENISQDYFTFSF